MNLGSFVALVVLVAGTVSAEFYWKDNKIVRQAELGNDALLKDTIVGQPTLNSLNSLNSIVVSSDAQKQMAITTPQQPVPTDLQSIKFDCTGKPTGPNKDPKYCDVYHACVFGKQSKTYACDQMGERFYYDENLQRYISNSHENVFQILFILLDRFLDASLLRTIHKPVRATLISLKSELNWRRSAVSTVRTQATPTVTASLNNNNRNPLTRTLVAHSTVAVNIRAAVQCIQVVVASTQAVVVANTQAVVVANIQAPDRHHLPHGNNMLSKTSSLLAKVPINLIFLESKT